MLGGVVSSFVREAAERSIHETAFAGAGEQLEQRERDAGGAVRIAGQVFLLLRPEGRHRRPGPGVVVVMCVRQQMLAEAPDLAEIVIAVDTTVDGAESGDRAGRAADDVERHRIDVVSELRVDEPERLAFQRRFVE